MSYRKKGVSKKVVKKQVRMELKRILSGGRTRKSLMKQRAKARRRTSSSNPIDKAALMASRLPIIGRFI